MRHFFEAYKKYIVKHPKKLEYKPTSYEKYDAGELYDVYKKVDNTIPCSSDDIMAIEDFVNMSSYMHNLYIELYKLINDNFSHLNLRGRDIAEFIIAGLNREYKVIWSKLIVSVNRYHRSA